MLFSKQHEQRPWIIPKSSGHAIDFILVEFCIEMFDGGKWQRLLYFSFIFEFDRAIDISSKARGQNFSSVKAEVVLHGSLYVNQHAEYDFKIS